MGKSNEYKENIVRSTCGTAFVYGDSGKCAGGTGEKYCFKSV